MFHFADHRVVVCGDCLHKQVQHEFTVEPTFATAVSPRKLKPAAPPESRA